MSDSENTLTEFIYRAPGNRGAKDLSLHKERDYFTGLSFLDYEYGTHPIIFRVSRLIEAGYIVIKDSETQVRYLPFLGGELFKYYDEYMTLPEGHYTVYHPDKTYWTLWHQTDLQNLNTPQVSKYLQTFYNLRENTDGEVP